MEVFESSIISKDDVISDKILFRQPPPKEDCPICFLRLPHLFTGSTFYLCCGKDICHGCDYALSNIDEEEKCPFCRTPAPDSDEEVNEREGRLVEKGNAEAIHNLGIDYREGIDRPRDYGKSLELSYRAAELGCSEAFCSIGWAYEMGQSVEVDLKKAIRYYELAAIKGSVVARGNLGAHEDNAGNFNRALKHCLIAVRGGDNDSLKIIKDLYLDGHATKEDYTKALRARQAYLGEIKSRQRDEAAADDDDYRYY